MVMLPLSVMSAYNLVNNTTVSNEPVLRQINQIQMATNILIAISWLLPILGIILIVFGQSKKKGVDKLKQKSANSKHRQK